MFSLLVHYRLWVASVVATLALFSATSLRLGLDVWALAVVFFCTLTIYNFDHVIDLGPSAAGAARLWAGASALTLGAVLTRVSWVVSATVVVGLGLIALYLAPPRRLRVHARPGLRATFKPLFVGTAVALGATVVPLLCYWAQGRGPGRFPALWGEAAVRTAVLALLCGANTVVFDVHDERLDREAGVVTPVVLLGSQRARKVVTLLGLLAMLATELAFLSGITRGFDVRSAVILGALVTVALAWLLPARIPRPWFALLVDGALMLPWLWLYWVGRWVPHP